MKYKTAVECQSLVDRQQESGLNVQTFCTNEPMARSSFYKARDRANAARRIGAINQLATSSESCAAIESVINTIQRGDSAKVIRLRLELHLANQRIAELEEHKAALVVRS